MAARALDVIIVTATGSLALLERCLASLRAHSPTLATTTITVVDNASRDGLVAALRERHPSISIHEAGSNRGYAAGANVGIAATSGDLVLLLNPDTEVLAGSIDRLISTLTKPAKAGLAGPRLVDERGRTDHNAKRAFPTPLAAVRHFAGIRPWPGAASYARTDVDEFALTPVDAISGCCMLARRDAIEDVGLLDEGYWMYGEDLDWCRRFGERGWDVLYVGEATVVHHKRGVTGSHLSARLNWSFHRAMGRFYRKYLGGRNLGLDLVVYAGIITKFALSQGATCVRRLSS